jgi:Sulfotransferase domain
LLRTVIDAASGAKNPAESRGPSFLFIGAGKAGSSWFMEILWEHPGVFVPPNKATYFFTRYYGLGLPWYEGFYSRTTGPRVLGEVCEVYMPSPEALARIKAYRPDMRLICCLRNPYERAVSAWRFFARNGQDQPTLVAQADLNPDVFEFGYYATQLRVVRSLFPERQILVIFFDEVISAPEKVARRVYEFIGADPKFQPPSLHRRLNASGRPRSRVLARLVHQLHLYAWGSNRTVANVIGRVKRIPRLRRAVRAALYDERPRRENWRDLISEFPSHVVARYEEEITALERMLNRDLSHWRSPPRARASQ